MTAMAATVVPARVHLAAASRVVFLVLAVAAYSVVLQTVYANVISGPFAYAGYTYVAPTWQANTFAIIEAAAVACCLPGQVQRVSHTILWVLFGVCVAPAMLMAGYTGYLQPSAAHLFTLMLGAAYLVPALGVRRGANVTPARRLSTRTSPSKLSDDLVRIGGRSMHRTTITWIVCGAYSAATYGAMAVTTGFSFHLVALDDVYSVRAAYSNDLTAGGPLGYLLSGQAYIVNVYVLMRALSTRNRPLFGVAVLAQFVLYSTTGFKTVLFSIPAIIAIVLALRSRRPRTGAVLLLGPLALVAVSAVVDSVRGNIELTGLFTRRFIVTPGLLTSVYADFFSHNPVALWARSFTRYWVHSPYETTPTKIIGQYMLPGSQVNANANLFADGFANLGPIGMFVIAVVLLVWLRFLDGFASGVPLPVLAALFVMSSVTLSNTSILTAMFSHGIAFGTVLVAIMPRTGWTFLDPMLRTPAERSAPIAQTRA